MGIFDAISGLFGKKKLPQGTMETVQPQQPGMAPQPGVPQAPMAPQQPMVPQQPVSYAAPTPPQPTNVAGQMSDMAPPAVVPEPLPPMGAPEPAPPPTLEPMGGSAPTVETPPNLPVVPQNPPSEPELPVAPPQSFDGAQPSGAAPSPVPETIASSMHEPATPTLPTADSFPSSGSMVTEEVGPTSPANKPPGTPPVQ